MTSTQTLFGSIPMVAQYLKRLVEEFTKVSCHLFLAHPEKGAYGANDCLQGGMCCLFLLPHSMFILVMLHLFEIRQVTSLKELHPTHHLCKFFTPST